MKLYHLSRTPNLETLTPQVPQHRAPGEKMEACICLADAWYKCAMLVPHGKELPLYIYEYDGEAINQENGGWLWDSVEYRVYEPVAVKYIGKLDISKSIVRLAFTRPCGNCLKPHGWCDDGAFCSNNAPSLEEALE